MLERTIDENGARYLFVGVAALVSLSLLAIGSVHVWTLVFVSVLAAVVLALALTIGPARLRTPAPALVMVALAAYCFLQSLPIPAGLLALLAPENAEIWARSTGALGEPPPSWVSVSLDPGASTVEGLKWLLYAAAFTSAAVLGAKRNVRAVALIVYASALVAGLTTIVHGAVGADRVFGIYTPRYEPTRWSVGPLINPNNLAGYLNLGAMCGFGLSQSMGRSVHRYLVLLGSASLIAIAFITASRGGVLALAAGVTILVVLTHTQRRLKRVPARVARDATLLLGATVLAGVALAFLGLSDAMVKELWDERTDKLQLFDWSRPMVSDFWLFGVGRGAFQSVFSAYRQGGGHIVYSHPENFVVAWAVEWGVFVAIIAAVVFVWHFRAGNLGAYRSLASAGIVAGAGALLFQNLFDLSLEVPGVVVALAVALGGAWGASQVRGTEDDQDAMPSSVAYASLRPAQIAAVTVAVAVGLVVLRGRHPVPDERERLHVALSAIKPERKESEDRFWRRLSAAIHRHPAEPYFPFLGALAALETRSVDPFPLLDRALERDPMNGRLHLAVAVALVRNGASKQAMLHLRLAAERDQSIRREVGLRATKLAADEKELLRAVPEGRPGAEVLVASTFSLGPERLSVRIERLKAALGRSRDYMIARAGLADALLIATEKEVSPCEPAARERCLSAVDGHISILEESGGTVRRMVMLKARRLELSGSLSQAEALLARECSDRRASVGCRQTWVRTAGKLGDDEKLQTAIDALLIAGCTTAEKCATTAVWLANFMIARGDHRAALAYLDRAVRERPTKARWKRLAKVATQVGAYAKARHALEKAGRSSRRDPELKPLLEAVRKEERKGLVEKLR